MMARLACDTCGSTRRAAFEAEKQEKDGTLKVRCKACLLLSKRAGGEEMFASVVRELRAAGWSVSEAWARKHAPNYL